VFLRIGLFFVRKRKRGSERRRERQRKRGREERKSSGERKKLCFETVNKQQLSILVSVFLACVILLTLFV